LILAQDER